jgi:hypothetical protein
LTRHDDFKAFAEGQSHGSAQANVSQTAQLVSNGCKKCRHSLREEIKLLMKAIESQHEIAGKN